MIIKIRSVFLALPILVAGLAIAPADTVTVESEKLSFALPDHWTKSNTENTLVSFGDPKSGSSAELFAFPNPEEVGLDQPSFLSGIKNGMTQTAASRGVSTDIRHEGRLTIHGVPFYLFQGAFKSANSEPVYFRQYATAANGKIYLLSLKTADLNADAVLETIASSFTFQAPPVLPDPSKRPKDPAERVGYLIGLVVGAVLAIVALKRFFPGHPRARPSGRKPNRNAGPRFRGRKEPD